MLDKFCSYIDYSSTLLYLPPYLLRANLGVPRETDIKWENLCIAMKLKPKRQILLFGSSWSVFLKDSNIALSLQYFWWSHRLGKLMFSYRTLFPSQTCLYVVWALIIFVCCRYTWVRLIAITVSRRLRVSRRSFLRHRS